jgi:catalase
VAGDNTTRAIGNAPDDIKCRHICNCARADAAYGAGVAKVLGIAI